MRIIQTYWNASGLPYNQVKGGWLSPEIHWMSWALSCTLLRRFYDDVELYTTEEDAKIFRKFKIPYTKIHTDLDCEFIRNLRPEMWAYAKIYTYSIQAEPFLHVDGDVFIWKPFKEELFNGDICVQNIEENLGVYHKSIETLLSTDGTFVPNWILENKDYPKAYNMGIFGANDLDFVRKYCDLAFEYYKKNQDVFHRLYKTDPNVNILPEQYLLYGLSEGMGRLVKKLYAENVKMDKDFHIFCEITKIPKCNSFLHTLGGCKKSPSVNDFIAHCLSIENKLCYEVVKKNVPCCSSFAYEDDFFSKFIKTITDNNEDNRVLDSVVNEIKRLEEYFKTNGDISFSRCKQLNVFPSYQKDNTNIHNKLDKYVGVNPNHRIVRTNYDFVSILKNDYILTDVNTQPLILFLVRFYNADGKIKKSLWLSPIELQLFEMIKTGIYTIRTLLANLDSERSASLIKMLEIMYDEELMYFCDFEDDLIRQENSTAYINFMNDYRASTNKVVQQFISRIDNKLHPSSPSVCGSSILDVVNVVSSYGFQSRAYKCEDSIPDDCKLPVLSIVNIWQTIPIYVIILDITDKYIVVYNPVSDMEEQHLKSSFYLMWSKYIITV